MDNACANTLSIVKRLQNILLTLFLLLCVALPAVAGKPFTLVIDAGHGGNDPGAVGQTAKEKNINLNVALALGKLIETNCKDVKVIYTRKTDVFVSLQGRADIANKAKADLFISIHTNSAANGSTAAGAETYTLGMHRAADNLAVARRENSVITLESDYKKTYQGFDPNKAESYIMFELMQDKYMAQSVKLAQAIQKQYASAGRRNKGVHQAGFLVLRETSMPSVLTELGFISNPAEEAFLNSPEGVNKLANSIFEGFRVYRRQLAGLDTPSQQDSSDLASATPSREDLNAHGATQDVSEDDVPSIRPVKTIPYPTVTPEKQENSNTSAPEKPKEQPKADKPKEQPKTDKPKEQPKADKPKEQPKADKPKEQPKADKPKEQPKTEKPKEKPKADKPKEQATPAKESKPEFRLQLFTSSSERKAGDASFKGLEADYYKDGDTYKYTYGKTYTYDEILALKKTIADKFPGVFVVALLDGKRIDLQQAIKLSKQK